MLAFCCPDSVLSHTWSTEEGGGGLCVHFGKQGRIHMAGLGAVSHSHCVSISESSQWLCQWGNVFEDNF